ncbi:glutaredoxin family protein [Lipingzhangella sp. LS1_29]|uniref:Glutaredoxin family protein n=1 Tax=Lipingzhangella rawalii TaxID=2055835 RepID=A0ABU2HAJ7_9ACTN|nr:glutaredoxin family protein [Lipingzhangella rawalii]MDS1271899.1 glutaredoxin family protein [Lipingzhangella rawalii]
MRIPEFVERDQEHRIILVGKADCHLCAEARDVVTRVATQLNLAWTERDLADCSQEERDEYWDKIPVTFVDGAVHDFWRVDERRLRAALGVDTT